MARRESYDGEHTMDRPPPDILAMLETLKAGQTLEEAPTRQLFESMFAGHFTDAQIQSILESIQQRGVTVPELVGGARAMRAHVTGINTANLPGPVIDTCGTGGAPKTFNVSTIAALVVAAAAPHQIFVAKHGNRSRTGRGSAEVLTALGVNVDASPHIQERCLRECGVCFCFAIHHHPAAKFAGPARRAIGTPTIFNLLGPLTNPAAATHQLLGVYAPDLAAKVAAALAQLGSGRSLVVHGHGGLDELSTTGPSQVWRVENGTSTPGILNAADFGFTRTDQSALTVDSLEAAEATARSILAAEPGPCREMVILSAGAALATALPTISMETGFNLARNAIDSGHAAQTLASLARLSRE